MDFLPIPRSCQERQWEVPFLDAIPYDGQGFLGFLERSEMSEGALIEGFSKPSSDAMDHSPHAFSCVQQWLFFGVLAELYQFINVPFALEDFKRQASDGRCLVTTAHVPDLISKAYELRLSEYRQLLTESELHDPEDSALSSEPGHELRAVIEALNRLQLLPGAEERITRLATVRKTATDFFRRLEISFGSFLLIYDHLVSPIMVSIDCLLELLDTVSNKFIPRTQWPEQYYKSPLGGGLHGWQYYYKDHLNRDGWCRNRLDRIFYKMNSHALRYMTSMLPSFEDQPHLFCGNTRCVVKRQVNPTIPHHDPSSCAGTCHSFDVDMSQLNLMIQRKALPLVMKGNDGSFALVAESLDCRFTAITHVWTHGLGNSLANALPLCQMERIFSFVQKIDPSRQARVWIDTLCVPAIGPYKTQAIAMLRDIYTRASEVLLIDSRLCRVSGSHAYENAIQFLCSEWLSRLWTFQEGYLARKLLIQFAVSAISQEDLVQNLSGYRARDWFGLASQLGFLLERETGFETSGRMSTFIWVLQKLQCRSTTVPADEAICLANILGISTPDPATLPSMQTIYQNVRIPSGLLFLGGPRLETPGFRWAPATFLNSNSNAPILTQDVATLQREGLLVNKRGILLNDTLTFRKNAVHLYWTLEPPLQSNTSEDPEGPPQDQNIYLLARADNTSFQRRPRQIDDPAIILDKDIMDSFIGGALVSRTREANSTWSCEFEMTLEVWMPGKKGYDGMRASFEKINQFSDPIPCLGLLLEDVDWIIG